MSIALDHVLPAPRARQTSGAVTGAVAMMLRLEGAVALTIALLGYHTTGASWALFAVLFLVPDVSMLGYLKDPRLGAAIYNIGHTYASPAVLAGAGLAFAHPLLLPIALIWAAHIGFDRVMGYGLKYPHAFAATHLG